MAGVLDIDASDKAARFIRFCDCFNIPLITLEDVPGFLPGCTQEHNGIIRHGAKIVYAYVEATVPKITLILRKAYGGAYIVMSSKQTGSDVNLSYPSAEIAVMGAEGAVNILYRNMNEEEKKKAIEEYRTNFANPYKAAELGYIDEIILPRQTRAKLIQALDMTHNKIRSNPPEKTRQYASLKHTLIEKVGRDIPKQVCPVSILFFHLLLFNNPNAIGRIV